MFLSKMNFIAGAFLIVVAGSVFINYLGVKTEILKDPDLQVSEKKIYSLPNPTLETIFSEDHNFSQKYGSEKLRVLIATGDIIPARSVNFQTIQRNNFNWAFEKTADFLKTGDLVFANLESPLIKNCPVTQEGMIFCGDERHMQGLQFAGINIVSLANNHAGNHNFSGVENTVNLLNQVGIVTTGVNGPVFKDIRGLKFAFLGYNEIGAPENGISWVEEEKIRAEIVQVKTQADLVIVTFHWGTEYVSQPIQKQRDLAHLAIDAGADLIIGNHPHWIQPIEIYQGKVITYAHGNFVFDQMWSQKTREGVVGKYTFLDKKLIDVEFFPVQIDDYGQPHFVDTIQKKQILDDMKNESSLLAN